jgi:hypothetical protein
MSESNGASLTCTDDPPVTALPPRPRPPVQRLTARPLPHDLQTSFTRADLNEALAAEGLRPVGIGEPAAWRAFRDDLPGGAA